MAKFYIKNNSKLAKQNAELTLEYLLAYSPDKTPIEQIRAKRKAIRRKWNENIELLFASDRLNPFIPA